MFTVDFLTLLAIIGFLQGIIFSIVFWKKNQHLSNRIFSILLVFTSVRIAKNILVHMRDLNYNYTWSDAVWDFLINIGILHQFAIGPLFLLYFIYKGTSLDTFQKVHMWHFLPYVLLLIASPFINWTFWMNGGLLLSYLSILLYFALTVRRYISIKENVNQTEQKWLKAILVISGLLILVYSPALFNYMGYIGGAVLYTFVILLVGYFIITNKQAATIFQKKYQTSSLLKGKVLLIKNKLEELMKTQMPYLNPNLSLHTLAEALSVSPHQLSQVINQEFGKSYADYVNAFRISEAASRLSDSNCNRIKISTLAYDSGFNSQPTFNTLFKKTYKLTPREYRQKYSA